MIWTAGGPGRRLARLLVALGTFVSVFSAAAELPLEAGEAVAGVATLDKIVALQRDHGLEIPAAFWFRHAQASLDAGLFAQAVSSALEYLNETGRDGAYCRESLQVLAAVELAKTTPGGVFRDSLQSGGEGPEMLVILAGRFRMGCLSNDDACDSDEKPAHGVTIGRPFALSVYEVTFTEWDACVAAGGCGGYEPPGEPPHRGWARGNRPVINVSWEDAQSFVSWLSRETGESYRLPSESEWEYAARAGTVTKRSWGNETGRNRANCDGCGIQRDDDWTVPVGSFAPNRWGLYDMHGNVWEWTEDCWNDSYRGAPSDGSAWLLGDCSRRVLRGGSWSSYPESLRAAHRYGYPTDRRIHSVGFRIARTLPP